jgi:hypothetical protein
MPSFPRNTSAVLRNLQFERELNSPWNINFLLKAVIFGNEAFPSHF